MMKSISLLFLAVTLLFGFISACPARAVRNWSYQELLEKSDLVVIATPTATNDTKENIDFPGFTGQRVVGIETSFVVDAILKGDKAMKNFVFHHYRTPDEQNISHVPNGPTFISFSPVKDPTLRTRTFLLFLHREKDGRYSPVVGQTDPGLSIKELKTAG